MPNADRQELDRLLGASQQGNREAFGRLMSLTMDRIMALTYRLTLDRELARDLTQETYLSAWEHRHDFRGESTVLTWLVRIATNKALNALRDRKPTLPIDRSEVPAPESTTPEQMHRAGRLQEEFRAFASELAPLQRAVFELRFYQQLPFEQIAVQLGRAVGTIKATYHQVVGKLRERATERGWR